MNGFFLVGCKWDDDLMTLNESNPKELYVEMPVIHLIPMKEVEINLSSHRYKCPVYKTSERRGMLKTTGHSTNFIMYILLPMPERNDQKHFIKLGTAMITLLDE